MDSVTDTGQQPEAVVAERRITSVLFGDLVGFTPLSEHRDPEETRELLSRYFAECRTVMSRYGGTIEKFIGDAVMAVWGVPVAHEDDAERAVRAGLELVEAIEILGREVGGAGLSMRVGIVTGEVAVTVGATAEGMVAGDAVNTASRVQSIAVPGQVWVDDATRTLTVAAITYQSTGEHELKGKLERVPLFQAKTVVASVGGGQRVDGLEAPMVGRDRELRLVKELFHATEEAGRPKLVVLDGEPGVGKSRLAWEFEKYIDGLSATIRWHRGRCLSYGEGVAFWALAEALRTRLGLVESDTGSVVADQLDESLERYVGDGDERAWLRPRLAALVGASEDPGNFAKEDLFMAWTTFLERLADGGHPVVLVIDDAQHADSGLLDFIDHVMVSAESAIFVLALARPELLARRHDLGGRRATVVRLDPLDHQAMSELVDGLVVGLPAEARSALVSRSEGIPLFAVETVRALIDRDVVVPRGGRYVPATGVDLDLETLGAPASLQALVAARLDALTPDERRVVCEASVLGLSFTREGLAAFGETPEGLDSTLESLRRKEVFALQQDRFSSELGQYRFVQGVVRQVAYATQSRRDRKQRHLAAAEHLLSQEDSIDELSVVIAQHLLDAVDASGPGDSGTAELTRKATALIVRSASRARKLGAPQDALHLYEEALKRTDDVLEAAHLRVSAASSAFACSEFERLAELASDALATFDERHLPVDAGIAAAWYGYAQIGMQDNAGAIEAIQPRWDSLQDVEGAGRAMLLLAKTLCVAHAGLGDFDKMAEVADRRLVLAEAAGDYDAVAHTQLQLGIRYVSIGAPATARALYESTASIAREHGLTERLAMALNNIATIDISRDLEEALRVSLEALETSRRSGVIGSVAFALLNHWLALWTAGRLHDAQSLLSESREIGADPTSTVIKAVCQVWIAEATGTAVPAEPPAASTDSESDLAWLANLQITRARLSGDTTSAARLAEESLPHLLAAAGLDDDFMHLWPPLILAALEADDVQLAERFLEPVASAAPGIVAPAVRGQFRRLRGLVGAARGDDPVTVEKDLRTGVEILTDFGAVIAAAQARDELGRWLVTQSRSDEGDELIAAAQATFLDIGALGWVHDEVTEASALGMATR